VARRVGYKSQVSLREDSWKKYFGITLDELDQITEAIAAVLNGRLVMRDELAREVEPTTGSAMFRSKAIQDSSGWGTLLRPAAFSGR